MKAALSAGPSESEMVGRKVGHLAAKLERWKVDQMVECLAAEWVDNSVAQLVGELVAWRVELSADHSVVRWVAWLDVKSAVLMVYY